MPTKCRICGDEFEQPVPGYFLSSCPTCWKRYLKGERHLKEKIKEERKQLKLI